VELLDLVGCTVVAVQAPKKEQVLPMPLLFLVPTAAMVLLELCGQVPDRGLWHEHIHQPIQVIYK
jgi:hypothetical protein